MADVIGEILQLVVLIPRCEKKNQLFLLLLYIGF